MVLQLFVGPDGKTLLVLPDGRLQLVFLLQGVALVAQLFRPCLSRGRVGILFELAFQRCDVAREPRVGPEGQTLLVLRHGLGNAVLVLQLRALVPQGRGLRPPRVQVGHVLLPRGVGPGPQALPELRKRVARAPLVEERRALLPEPVGRGFLLARLGLFALEHPHVFRQGRVRQQRQALLVACDRFGDLARLLLRLSVGSPVLCPGDPVSQILGVRDDPHPIHLWNGGMERGDGLVIGRHGLDDLPVLLQGLAVGPVFLHPPLVLVVLHGIDCFLDVLRVEGPVEREALAVLRRGLVVLRRGRHDVGILRGLLVEGIGLGHERPGQPVLLQGFLPALQRAFELLDLLLHVRVGNVLEARPVLVDGLLDMRLHVHLNVLAPLAGAGLNGGEL